MKLDQLSEKEISDKFNGGMQAAETGRADGLQKLQALQMVKNRAQIKEHRRLQAKLGPQHPRVQDLESRIQYNKGLAKDLTVEIDKSTIEAPVIDEKSWMIHGRVMDIELVGLSGVTIGIFDAQGRWLREAGHACTDERGYFAIVYVPAQKAGGDATQPVQRFLHLIGPGDRLLHKDNDPLRPKAGRIEYREYYLDPDAPNCEAPQGGQPEMTLPSCESWVLRGRVFDTRKKPLPGMEVGVFFSKDDAEQKLGSAKTVKNGRYEVTYRTKDAKKGPEPGAHLLVIVTDGSGKRVYKSEEDLIYKPGQTVIFNIQIHSPG